MGARRLGERLGRQDPRKRYSSAVRCDRACRLDAGLDHGDGAEALEARLVGIAPLAAHPVDALGDKMAAGSMRPWAFSVSARTSMLIAGRAVKIQFDLGMARFLVVLEWPEE